MDITSYAYVLTNQKGVYFITDTNMAIWTQDLPLSIMVFISKNRETISATVMEEIRNCVIW